MMQGFMTWLRCKFCFVFEEMHKSVNKVTKYLCEFPVMLILSVVSLRVNVLVKVVLLLSEEEYSI